MQLLRQQRIKERNKYVLYSTCTVFAAYSIGFNWKKNEHFFIVFMKKVVLSIGGCALPATSPYFHPWETFWGMEGVETKGSLPVVLGELLK